MLSDKQRQQIETAEADRLRSALSERREMWGGLRAHRIRGLMDDLRATVVEEPWFGKSVSERLNDVSRMVHEPDHYNVLAAGTEKAKDLMREFYGYDEPEATRSDPEHDHER